MATTISNKRKASNLVEGASINKLTEKGKALVTELGALKERVGNIDDLLDAFADIASNIENRKSYDQVLESIRAPGSDGDLSDFEECVVDQCEKWASMFLKLRDYKITHGDCNVPQKFNDDPKLGTWVKNQKLQYNRYKTGKKGASISPERIEKLESIGFCWGKKYPEPLSFDDWYERLKRRKEQTGNCNVPFNSSHPTPLAKWLAYQRTEYLRLVNDYDSLLTWEQAQKLKNLGIKWKGPRL